MHDSQKLIGGARRLTAVICTYNRSTLLMNAVESLNRCKSPPDWEVSILVIANACTDATIEKLSEYQSRSEKNGLLPLEFEEERIPGKSYALNRAVKLVPEGYFCFVDDDHRVDQGYFSAISDSIETYQDSEMFCGKIIPDWTGNEPNWIHEEGKYKIYPLPVPNFQLGDMPLPVDKKNKLPGGGNLIIHKTVFNRVGEFSTLLGPTGDNLLGSEDSEFLLRALASHVKLQYVPGIIQYHHVDIDRLRLRYLLQKGFQRSRSITLAHNLNKSPVPMYLWRKFIRYTVAAIFSFKTAGIRFYLIRIAATLGEMQGLRESLK